MSKVPLSPLNPQAEGQTSSLFAQKRVRPARGIVTAGAHCIHSPYGRQYRREIRGLLPIR